MENLFDINCLFGTPVDDVNMDHYFNLFDTGNVMLDQYPSHSGTESFFNPLENDDTISGAHQLHNGTSPFSSGFDEEHPMPTYEELRNAGFPPSTAAQILYYPEHDYSERELFHCLYESDDPYEAFKEMERQKMRDLIDRTDETIRETEELLRRLPY